MPLIYNQNNDTHNNDDTVYKIFKKVNGTGTNDVIIFKDLTKMAKYNLVYFGGDVQDYLEEMLKSSTGKNYSKWNLIDTGKLLVRKFSQNSNHVVNVIIIRPDHFHLKTFANYSNFLNSNHFGAPINPKEELNSRLDSEEEKILNDEIINDTPKQPNCWNHFKLLFENSLNQFNKENSNILIDSNLPIILIGFSKGCIVLNELCNELELIKDSSLIDIRQKVTHLIYLDGGHCGTANAWITREDVISFIKTLNWTCYVYITPYNMTARSIKLWAIKEHEIFIELLKKHQVKLVNKCYFANENTDDFDLNKHFEILSEFEIDI